ncbi:MAG: class I SAM-dependent methyltransferase [Cyclobacteriaceae bacterium]
MTEMAYTAENSTYKEQNPSWHTEDSPWKATQILKIMERNNLSPKSIVEIGCGAGEILNQLYSRLQDKTVEFSGFEISPDAYRMSKERENERLKFYQEDLLALDKIYDLLLMIDVFEHVEDYLSFIRKAKNKADYKIYHIPLDISYLNLMTNRMMKQRRSVGHLHYFTKDTALASLTDTGHEIVDWFYTKYSHELHISKLGLNARLVQHMRSITYAYRPNLAASIFGGYSLIVLAR